MSPHSTEVVKHRNIISFHVHPNALIFAILRSQILYKMSQNLELRNSSSESYSSSSFASWRCNLPWPATSLREQGRPGFQISPGVDFFRAIHPPSPSPRPKTDILEIFQDKHVGIWYLLQPHFGMSVQSSMPCVIPLVSTPVKPYMHALFIQRMHQGKFSFICCNQGMGSSHHQC